MYQQLFKRCVDIVCSAAALIAFSPIMIATAVAIRLEDGGPALFSQQRSGRDRKPFRVLKFRSMPVNTAHVTSAEARTLRVTRVGKFIRRTNIDELPQLLNVLHGDMSLIGPRPALPSQTRLLEMRTANSAIRLRPGMTGLAQINSYDNMPEDEKASWDGKYAANVSFWTDVKIVVGTLGYLTKPPPVY